MTDQDYEAEKVRKQRRQDKADFDNEMAGVDAGRLRRFTTKEQFERSVAARTSQEPDTASDRLLARLADPVYRQAYEQFTRELDIQDRAADLALQEIDHEIYENRIQHQRMLDEAYRLRDGRRVFMTADGTAAYDEHRNRLMDSEFAALPKAELVGKPTWDEVEQGDRELIKLRRDREDVVRFKRDGLEEGRRAETGDLSIDELDDIKSSRAAKTPERVKSAIRRLEANSGEPSADSPTTTLSADEKSSLPPRSASAASTYLGTKGIAGAPDLGGTFAHVADGGQVDEQQSKPRPPALALSLVRPDAPWPLASYFPQ